MRQILALDEAPAVELAAEEEIGRVWFERPASTLADAIVRAVFDLEGLGLRPVQVEPRDQVTVPESAARLDRPVEELRAWLAGTLSEPGAPAPYRMRTVGPEKMFSWNELAAWTRERLDATVPDDAPIIQAASLAVRLRRCAQGVPEAGPLIAALLGPAR